MEYKPFDIVCRTNERTVLLCEIDMEFGVVINSNFFSLLKSIFMNAKQSK